MKKILVLATAVLLVSGASFAQEKKCGGSCCKDKGKTVKTVKTVKKDRSTAKI